MAEVEIFSLALMLDKDNPRNFAVSMFIDEKLKGTAWEIIATDCMNICRDAIEKRFKKREYDDYDGREVA
jgi:hypothetical protein